MLVNTFYENKVDQLLDVVKRLHEALTSAGIRYQVIGGFAVFCHMDRIDPLAARLTRDVDIAIERSEIERLAGAAQSMGMQYRHVAGVDMLVDACAPKIRSAVHLIFAGEKVRPEYTEPVPLISDPARTAEGILIAPVADLVRMKLTSFRLKDQVHIQDMDSVGLITAEIQDSLPEALRERLSKVRASE